MSTRIGPKRMLPEGSEEEALELNKLYDDLREQLSLSRTDRVCGRALAVWDDVEKAVRVLQKDGKFGTFGYSNGGRHFLEFYEALFLLEMNRLQLEYHSSIMSVEQAYLLLLGETPNSKFNEYLVYSHLTRTGYILVRHQNNDYYDNVEPTEVDCAWAIALSIINNRPISENVKKSKYYAKVKKQMKHIKECIANQQIPEKKQAEDANFTPINFDRKIEPNVKRKVSCGEAENPSEAKRRCFEMARHQRSFLDCLKDDPEYKEFKEVFEKFDIVQMNETDMGEQMDGVRTLQISFDLYMHNDGFRKSTPKPPTFRIIILGVNEAFPKHAEIAHTYNLQKYPVPLLLVSVGESKQIQAFLYYFS